MNQKIVFGLPDVEEIGCRCGKFQDLENKEMFLRFSKKCGNTLKCDICDKDLPNTFTVYF